MADRHKSYAEINSTKVLIGKVIENQQDNSILNINYYFSVYCIMFTSCSLHLKNAFLIDQILPLYTKILFKNLLFSFFKMNISVRSVKLDTSKGELFALVDIEYLLRYTHSTKSHSSEIAVICKIRI